ncbi:MAG: hypothetical protein WAS23_04805 [Dokdonella sp.]|uniref:hypothetical protein n=1 Tax=Dokdonella sp. TaxID=2291710 RepID=UPI003BB032D6
MSESLPHRDVPRRRSATSWIIGGVVALFVLLVVGAAGGFVWYGIGLFNDQAGAAIRADPGVVDAVGAISEIHLDFSATGEAPGSEEFAYRITGERAQGLLVGRFVTVDADTEELREGSLTLDDGRVIAIGTVRNSSGAARTIAPETDAD